MDKGHKDFEDLSLKLINDRDKLDKYHREVAEKDLELKEYEEKVKTKENLIMQKEKGLLEREESLLDREHTGIINREGKLLNQTGEIIDVDPEEAELNLDVIEALFDFFFVNPALVSKKKAIINQKLQDAGKPPMK